VVDVVDSVDVPPAGEAVVVVLVLVLVLECECVPPAGDGFTMVVLFSVFVAGEAPGATVSTRCSHAPRSAALASMQIIFFMVCK
jgi:predicted RNA-binding protein with TRAM domain